MSQDTKPFHVAEECSTNEKCKVTGCLFNHTKRPTCRNGLACDRVGCWYNHFDSTKDSIKKQVQSRPTKLICRYGKSCKSKKCIYNHPGRPACRSGDNCFSKFCWYNHPALICIHRNCKKEKDTLDPCLFRHSRRSEQPGSWRDRDGNHSPTSEEESEASSNSSSDSEKDDEDESEKPDEEKRIHLPVYEERMRALGCFANDK